MKVQINIIPPEKEEEVQFNVHSTNENITKAIHLLTSQEKEVKYLLCKKEEKFFKIAIAEIFYLETIDRKVFAYTSKDTFEVSEKLYVLEEQLSGMGMIRVSKSMLLNMDKIYSFYPKLSGNLEALLVNEEKVVISRRYVARLKKELGMGESE
jgi:DNA-binding LytR/AlgR family response regulator